MADEENEAGENIRLVVMECLRKIEKLRDANFIMTAAADILILVLFHIQVRDIDGKSRPDLWTEMVDDIMGVIEKSLREGKDDGLESDSEGPGILPETGWLN